VFLASSDKLTLQSPELWVYLLGLSVLLTMALRRVVARQTPLTDELYAKTVAMEHIQSGVAWVRSDCTVSAMNAAFLEILSGRLQDFRGRHWHTMFAEQEEPQLEANYRQMLLLGKVTFDAYGKRVDGSYAGLEVRLVAVHDHKMRFQGHHCLVVDRTRERILEEQIREQTAADLANASR